jgi:carboxyl-terminal processing protease
VFIRDKLALAQKLMRENRQPQRSRPPCPHRHRSQATGAGKHPPQGQGRRAAQRAEKEDEDALPAEPDKTKPEDDAYLSETGRILLDYLKLSNRWPSTKMMAI